MSLDWNISNIADNDTVCKLDIQPDGSYIVNPITELLIFSSMWCSYSNITEANWQDIWCRINLYQRLFGPTLMLRDDERTEFKATDAPKGWYLLTAADVYKHIGLQTNGGNETFAKFKNRIVNVFIADSKKTAK